MALGKGLGAILQEVGDAYANEMTSSDDFSSSDTEGLVAEIDLDQIDPNPYQPRKYFDENKLLELGESIQQHGLLQPVVVIKNQSRYLLIAGERRLRAHKLIKAKQIKAIIADVDFDEIRMRELALIENIQRENLNPIELANSYQELISVHNITHEELSHIVYKSRSQITNTMRLLSLDTYAQNALISNQISQGHAKILITLDKDKQKVAVDTIVGQKLSVRETERLIKNAKKRGNKKENIDANLFRIDKHSKNKIYSTMPFKHKVKQTSIEILLPDEEELIKFISFIENK